MGDLWVVQMREWRSQTMWTSEQEAIEECARSRKENSDHSVQSWVRSDREFRVIKREWVTQPPAREKE